MAKADSNQTSDIGRRPDAAADKPKDPKLGRRRGRGPLRVLVVRHAVAEDKADFAATGRQDADRPLTKAGRRKFRDAARGIVELVPDLGVLATSPLARAAETADLLARRYAKVGRPAGADRDAEPVTLAALAPGKSPNLLLGWLADRPRGETVAVVGHEPGLGQFVSWVLTGLRESFVELKKGSACLLEFEDDVRPGRATLLWALRPGQLRAIGRAAREA